MTLPYGAVCIPAASLSPEMAGNEGPKLVTAFNVLNHTTRAKSAGSICAHAAEFSRIATLGSLYGSNGTMYKIKAPGTDYYLPGEIAHFAPALQSILDYHYGPKNVGSGYRNGEEVCLIRVEQHGVKNDEFCPVGPSRHHTDGDVDAFVANGQGEVSERYLVCDKLPTYFYDFDFDIPAEQIKSVGDETMEYWNRLTDELAATKAMNFRRFNPYEIVHFDATTVHAIDNPPDYVPCRTILTLTFSSAEVGAVIDTTDKALNPCLARAYRDVCAPRIS